MVRFRFCCRINSKCDCVCFFFIQIRRNGCQWCYYYVIESKLKGNDIKLVVIVFYDLGYIENEKVLKIYYFYFVILNYC